MLQVDYYSCVMLAECASPVHHFRYFVSLKKIWERPSERVIHTLPDYYDTNLTKFSALYNMLSTHVSIDGCNGRVCQPRFQSVLVLH